MNTSILFDAPGPRGRRRIFFTNILGGLALLVVAAWVIWSLAEKGQFSSDKWSPFLTGEVWVDYLFGGLWSTLTAAALSIVTSNIFGVALGIGRLHHLLVVRFVSGVLVEFFRAVPVLILMIFFYFFFSAWGIGENAPFWGVVVGLTLYNGSVIAELVRSGVRSLPNGQHEAGLAVGLSLNQTLFKIELPQALIAMMPAMVSQIIVILKDTALGYLITYSELLRQARLVGTSYSNTIPALIVVSVIFVLLNMALAKITDLISMRLDSRTAHRHTEATVGPKPVERDKSHFLAVGEGTELPENPFVEENPKNVRF